MLDTVSFFFNRAADHLGLNEQLRSISADPQSRSPGRNRHRKR